MPEYNTRLRTNSQILPPRRLRQDESSPQSSPHRPGKSSPLSSQPPLSPPHPSSLSQFPLLRVQLHPDDATNKTFLAIGRAFFSIENRAVTIKDLSYLTMKHGLACQNASAASQAITTFIRNHLNRCRQDHSMPVLLSLPLTGTDADDRLTPALYSRSGGNSASLKSSHSTLTNFRRGTTVWYLSEVTGAVCPFQKAGLSFNDIVSPALQNGTKRKRESQSASTQPKKCHVNSAPSSPTRTDVKKGPFLPRIKLTLKLPSSVSTCQSPPPSDSESDLSSSDGDGLEEDSHTVAESESESPTPSTASLSLEDDSDDFYDDSSDIESSIPTDALDDLQVISPSNNELYPGSSAIPSSSNFVPCNDAYSFYFTPDMCPTQLIKSTLTSFLSKPSSDSRAESTSPSQSAASPPPDSEDEDDDYHNSMVVGLRRESVPVPENCLHDNSKMPKFEPISPKFLPGSVHSTRKTPELEIPFEPKPDSSSLPPFDSASTPLETLPGFVLDPEFNALRTVIKEELTTTLSCSADSYFCLSESKSSRLQRDFLTGSGSINDPIQIEIVHDVEVLGPETVRSREWDMAWSQFDKQAFDRINVDHLMLFQEDTEEKQDVGESSMPALPSPPCGCDTSILPFDNHQSTVMVSTLSCHPAIIAVTVEDLWLYYTMLGPDAPLARRVDNDTVNITQLHRFLQIPLEYLLMDVPSACLDESRASGVLGGTWVPLDIAQVIVRRVHDCIPANVVNVFLSTDLGRYFPNFGDILVRERTCDFIMDAPMEATYDENDGNVRDGEVLSDSSSPKDICIRVEDLFGLTDCTDTHETESRLKTWMTKLESIRPKRPGSICVDGPKAGSALLGSWEQNVPFLDEQEEELFHSFVDLDNDGTPRNQHLSEQTEKCASSPLSPLISSPVSSIPKSNDTLVSNVINEKENSSRPAASKGRRNKAHSHPVRRSMRVASKALPATRLRRRTK